MEDSRTDEVTPENNIRKSVFLYLFLPCIFLIVTLLGGIRLSGENQVFLFLKPALICLILSALLFVSFFRAKILVLNEWFSEDFSILQNVSNFTVLGTLYCATTQVFNSLLPEKSLAFWVIAFCFFWTLWSNLFAEFTQKRFLQNLVGLCGLAFIVKYLILFNLTNKPETLTQKIVEILTKEASFGLLDFPQFSPATGYLQFLTFILYFIGVYWLSNVGLKAVSSSVSSAKT